ncbi:MAG TPA: CsbD family protein [Longimicrobiales bacterium]|nr:CsbD family protein [Longimicrobiales bacterium]
MADDIRRRGAEDSTEGKLRKAGGRIKDAAGGLTGDERLQAEGKRDELAGGVQDAAGRSERRASDEDLQSRGVRHSMEGKADKLKGHVKDAAGGLTGDESLQAEGKIDQLKGKVKDTFGKIERDLDD